MTMISLLLFSLWGKHQFVTQYKQKKTTDNLKTQEVMYGMSHHLMNRILQISVSVEKFLIQI